ncbi:hypothetical protein D030_1909B, partial [Vibrio parahaemolyticus AQ3810]
WRQSHNVRSLFCHALFHRWLFV